MYEGPPDLIAQRLLPAGRTIFNEVRFDIAAQGDTVSLLHEILT
jgi:hypothetical protein